MIEVAAGVIGFASGIALTIWLSRRKRVQKNNWSKGYRILGNKDENYTPTVQKKYEPYRPKINSNSSYNEPENKEPPTMPDWF